MTPGNPIISNDSYHWLGQYTKSQEIKSNNEVAVVFYWREIHRQIRVEGIAEKAPKQISDSDFDTRPRGGQLSALASPQSKVIKSRKEIEKKLINQIESMGVNK